MWLLHPLVLCVNGIPLIPSSSQYVVSPPGLSSSYCVCVWHRPLPLIHLFPLRNPQKMSLVSHLQFIQFKGMVKESVRSFLDVSIDLEILIDLEAELIVEVEIWEVDVEGMRHFLLLVHLLQL